MCDTEVDTPQPPDFLTRPKPLTVPEGSSAATFTCRVQGHPPPTVSWERNGLVLSSNERYKISRDGERHSLEVVRPRPGDSGPYVCHLRNRAGTATHTCTLTVTEAPGSKAGSSATAGATVDYRSVLKSRQGGTQPRPQRSTDSQHQDKENHVHDFRRVLRNNHQPSPPLSTTATASTITTTARLTHRTVINGTSSQSSPTPSLSSLSSSTSSRSGGVRRNLDVFEKQASPSPDRSALTSRHSASPDSRPSPERSTLTSRHSVLPDSRPSPERSGVNSGQAVSSECTSTSSQDSVKGSGAVGRRRPDPVQESKLTPSSVQLSQNSPVVSKERFREGANTDLKTCTTDTNFSQSVDHIHSRKSDLPAEPSKTDFRSVLSKTQGVSERSRNFAQPSTDSKPSWSRPDPPRDQKKNGYDKDIKQTAAGKVDFRSVLKNRQTENGRASSVSRDSKPKVQHSQSEADFRSVLAKFKPGGEDRKPTQAKTTQPRATPERGMGNKSSSSKDLNSLRSKFETAEQVVNSVQSKPSKPLTTTTTITTTTNTTASFNNITTTDTTSTSNITTTTTTTTATTTTEGTIPPSGRSGIKASDSTTCRWTEGRGERGAVKEVDTAAAEDKSVDVIPSVGDTSRFTDDLKCSDSSQLSDSAISSAFSKLSELSDFSDSSSVVSEVEVSEPRTRRRLERLKERLGGGGGGEEEGGEGVKTAPRIQQRLENCRVKYGGQVALKCKVSGVPLPDIQWTANQKTIKPSRFFQLSYQENVAQLLVAEAFSEDEGEYTCTATNSSGTDSCSCYVKVEASSSRSSRSGSHVFEGPVSTPPRIDSLTPATHTVRCGQSATFQLTFSGEPTPTVTWYRAKTLLCTDDRVTIVKESGVSTLTIPSASANDSGRYTATLTNDLGTDQLSVTLSVEDVPECPVGVPHVYDISRKSVSLSWCGPAYDGGSVVTHYVIEVKEADSSLWTTLVDDCKSNSYHVLTLKADTSYQFRVRAVNRLGVSEPSLPTPSVVMMDPLHTSEDYESDDELPFEPREVTLAPGRKFEDHYEYLHEVGKGKFGSVYKCKDKQTGKIWAAKVLKVREKEKAGVRQEVEVMNKLAHPKLLMLWDAFEAPRTMVLVMEYVGAGELFERVIREDFVLTERDCVHFLRQICTGVSYMHSKSILHLDLKPENVLCVAENSNQIKIIDFGLARFFKPGDSLQVLFGTPEFIAPEVVNYDEIGFSTDMWSIGVICYILLSGLSPFLGDNEAETLSNVTSGEYDFDDESFDDISDKAKDFIGRLLVKRKEKRLVMAECEKHPWLSEEDKRIRCKRLNTDRLRCFMARRKWQKTGNAIRALGRMASMQKLLAGGSTSQSSSGSLSSASDTTSVAPPPSGTSTPVFSPPVHQPPATHHPLSSAAVREVEEKRGAGAFTSSRGGDRGKGDSSVSAEKRDLKTTTAADKESSPSSWRRGGQERRVPDTPAASSGRSKLTREHAISEDVADSAPNARAQTLPQPRAPASNNKDTKRDTDKSSPSPAPRADQACAPRFVKEMVDCTAFRGDVVRFDVTVTGQPPPRLVWLMEEEEVEEDERHVVEQGEDGHCSLIVRHVTEDDEGEYMCRAVNSQGETTCAADLNVYSMGSV